VVVQHGPRRLQDFATLYSYLWYRDFPVGEGGDHDVAQRADWTIHIGVVVRACADLMGLFARFESGGRTDAVLRDRREEIAAVEWEWLPTGTSQANELEKLRERTRGEFGVLITYADERDFDEHLRRVTAIWSDSVRPLLLLTVVFRVSAQYRIFTKLLAHSVQNGSCKSLREQEALPWKVASSRWSTC
jgi:hypothetical protein